eukprot:TRINITY_DN477_c0_g1_i1.p1 TRINITY_DN477_c0_g1~~TRINITY_DN477_c0_g1_i1.p1  ORF type:complete len:709 (-),score=96.38 TRINITY_DN477_c0_g1_i1:67-2193(-)
MTSSAILSSSGGIFPRFLYPFGRGSVTSLPSNTPRLTISCSPWSGRTRPTSAATTTTTLAPTRTTAPTSGALPFRRPNHPVPLRTLFSLQSTAAWPLRALPSNSFRSFRTSSIRCARVSRPKNLKPLRRTARPKKPIASDAIPSSRTSKVHDNASSTSSFDPSFFPKSSSWSKKSGAAGTSFPQRSAPSTPPCAPVAKESNLPFHHRIGKTSEMHVGGTSSKFKSEERDFEALGLSPTLLSALAEMRIRRALPIQAASIPPLLSKKSQFTYVASQTGTGKTLAYMLPLFENLKRDEALTTSPVSTAAPPSSTPSPTTSEVPVREDELSLSIRPGRPRAIILAHNRELVEQIRHVASRLAHHHKLRTVVLTGGVPPSEQKRLIKDKHVDVLIATPGRLLEHITRGNLYLSDCMYLVVDEADTILGDGFLEEFRSIVLPLLKRQRSQYAKDRRIQYTFASATLTDPIKDIISREVVEASASIDAASSVAVATKPLAVSYILSPKLHRNVPMLDENYVSVKGQDKEKYLVEMLKNELKLHINKSSQQQKPHQSADDTRQPFPPILVFCNTVSSCRATEHALKEAGFRTACYHGDILPNRRREEFEKFTKGDVDLLVCTDIASRGLDTTFVEHVVLYDFPLNFVDFLHRSGRTARGGRRGRLTCLLQKRDEELARSIQLARKHGRSLVECTGSKSINTKRTRTSQRRLPVGW